ncbi:MAG: hypothetical protein ACC742_10565, partial [Thermoanaerobaculales bacterium]
MPTRAEIDDAAKEYLTHGAPHKADVYIIDLGEGAMVVKDFSGRSWWRRLIGRREIAREYRAYSYLGLMPCFPRFYGRIDADALAVERIEGVDLAFAPDAAEAREGYLEQLSEAMRRLTDLGFLHLDARSRKNVLVRSDGRVVFIDLAGAFWIAPGRLGHRLFRSFIALYYQANLIKWETLLTPGGDPRQRRTPRYYQGAIDLYRAWKRLS